MDTDTSSPVPVKQSSGRFFLTAINCGNLAAMRRSQKSKKRHHSHYFVFPSTQRSSRLFIARLCCDFDFAISAPIFIFQPTAGRRRNGSQEE